MTKRHSNLTTLVVGCTVAWLGQSESTYPVTKIDDTSFWVRHNGCDYDYPLSSGNFKIVSYPKLTPQAEKVLAHIRRAGSITQREAMVDHSVQSLTRRITELRDAGFVISREFRFHPITGQRYARYALVA